MKIKSFILLLTTLTILFIASCSGTSEEDVAGTWKPAETNIVVDTNTADKDQIIAMERLEKSVYFVLNEDMSMKAVTSGMSIKGTWSFDKENGHIYVLFEGSGAQEPSYLGAYSHGKLIKYHEAKDMKITTTYEKE